MEDYLGLVYLFGLLWSVSLLFFTERYWTNRRSLFVIGMIPLGIILAFRYSGTDTYQYETLLWYSYLSGQPTGMEPGFDLLARWLTNLWGSPLAALRAIGVIFVGALTVFLWRSDPKERFFLLAFFIPVFFFQYGMNAIRAGLAVASLLLAWQSLRRNHWASAIAFGFLGPFFHLTILVPVTVLLFVESLRIGRRGWIIWVTIGLINAVLLLWHWDYVQAKLDFYFGNKLSTIHTVYSPQVPGMSRTAMALVLLIGLTTLPLSWGLKIFSWLTLGIPTLFFQILAYYSAWVGIRFVELMVVTLPLFTLRLLDLEHMSPFRTKSFFLALSIAAIIGSAFNYKNFVQDYNGRLTGSLTPFLPYRTVLHHQPCPPSYYFPWALPWKCPLLDLDNLGGVSQPIPR
ncbi:EpsG family protein [Thermus albus]|uniref:EpsG family protein n=1 Tax=Thermus albus TaxID=2908146 RepID=UPI001FA9DB78|nr:EpsG family protein [Thermus albus]